MVGLLEQYMVSLSSKNILLMVCLRHFLSKYLSHTNIIISHLRPESLTNDHHVSNFLQAFYLEKSHHSTRLEFINHNFLNPARLISIHQFGHKDNCQFSQRY